MRLLPLLLLAACAQPADPVQVSLLSPEAALSAWNGPVGRCAQDLNKLELVLVRTPQQIGAACDLPTHVKKSGCYQAPRNAPGEVRRPPRITIRLSRQGVLAHEYGHWLMECSGEAERLEMKELGHGHPLFEETVQLIEEMT